MFGRIRLTLVGWTMLVLTVILATLGTVIYAALQRALLDQVDRTLASQADGARPILESANRGRLPPGREGYRGGVFFLLVDGDGGLIANPQQLDVSGMELPRVTGPQDAYRTVTVNGEPARVFIRPLGPPPGQEPGGGRGQEPGGGRGLGPRNEPGAWLLVGQSLASEGAAMRSLLSVLVIGGLVGLVLSFVGARFLAGRALVPIEQAFRRQREFVADASHELRTPLTVLRSATDLVHRQRSAGDQADDELLDDIRAEVHRLERLATDLLTLARSDAEQLELAVAPVDASLIAEELVRRTAPLAHEREVDLAFEKGTGPTVVEADPDRLQQAALVLLDNAIKHTSSGGEVRVAVNRQDGHVFLEVRDSGAGIEREHLPRVFDRFYRVDSARSRAQGGSGLGLSIAKAIVDAHGGDLSLVSTPGKGTRATIRLRAVADA